MVNDIHLPAAASHAKPVILKGDTLHEVEL
ncbi:hypothetical protein S101395_02076 [Bacillus sonorensis]|uniref:Uncharacterized protein n=2 Tax=Bacillus sonorensis TaxID=119858 RepID=M5PII2_9BACI|nr:hypothetical protein S101395_02076 [Bacillus sonorensis]EME76607.1 hypothetical protein BSONL12_02462 [Bacillus sonorensis L12]